MSMQEILHDVPADKLAMVMAQYQSVNASVQVSPQSDGKFTVTATFQSEYKMPLAMSDANEAVPSPIAHLKESFSIPIHSKDYNDISAEYLKCFDTFITNTSMKSDIDSIVGRIIQVSPRYISLARELSVPWEFIGLIHKMESDTNFSTHLHNGDPLSGRTVQVPQGRPIAGAPPFSWEESARDAIKYEGFFGLDDWNTATILFRLERYNGFGYRDHGIFTPYLWGGSNLYSKGRYTRDHYFDSESVSQRYGAAVLLKALRTKNVTDT